MAGIVTQTATYFAGHRPELDAESRRAILATANARPSQEENPGDDDGSAQVNEPSAGQPAMAEQAIWMALVIAPEEGIGIGDPMRATGMTRSTIYRHLRQHVGTGHVAQVSRSRRRARITEEPSP